MGLPDVCMCGCVCERVIKESPKLLPGFDAAT